jgi:hypothetical protein
LRNNKNGGFGLLFISLLLANLVEDTIYRITGIYKYNMFIDDVNIFKLLLELFVYCISFIPTYFLVKWIRNRFLK